MKRKKVTCRWRRLIPLSILMSIIVGWLILALYVAIPSRAEDGPTLIYSDEYSATVPGDPIRCGSTSIARYPRGGGGSVRIECGNGHISNYTYTEHNDGSIDCDECGQRDISAAPTHMSVHFRSWGCQAITGYKPGAEISSSLQVYSDGSAILSYEISSGTGGELLTAALGDQSFRARNGTIEMTFTENGVYHASVTFSNTYQKEWTFTIDTLPVEVTFRDTAGIKEENSVTMYMHHEEESVDTYTRYGYLFDGYTDENGVKSYDENGNLSINYIGFGQMSKTLTIDWEAKKYNVYYTYVDSGIPTYQTAQLIFDSPLPVISVNTNVDIENGKVFCGYKLDDLSLYDAYGNPLVDKLEQELEPMLQHYGRLVLNEVWKPIDLYLYFGADGNGDGRPDQKVHITDSSIPDLRQIPERVGYRFNGLEYNGERIFAEDGKASEMAIQSHIVEWVRSEDEVILQEVWEIKEWDIRYGKDEDGDGVPDRSLHIKYGDPIPELDEPGETEAGGGTFIGWGVGDIPLWDEDGKPLKEHFDMDLDPWLNNDGEVHITDVHEKTGSNGPANGTGGNSSHGSGSSGHTDDQEEMILPDTSGMNNSSISDNSVSDNSVSENSTEDTSAQDTASNSGENEDGDPEEDGEDGNANGGRQSADAATDRSAEDRAESEQDTEAEDTDTDKATEETDPGSDAGVERLPAPIPIGADSGRLAGPGKNQGTTEQEEVKRIVLQVVKAAAVTGGVSGALLGAYIGMVYLAAMAEIVCITSAGKEKRLGKLTIRSERGKAFRISIPQRFIEGCDTGRLKVCIPVLFAFHNRKRELIIETGRMTQIERVSREIAVNI